MSLSVFLKVLAFFRRFLEIIFQGFPDGWFEVTWFGGFLGGFSAESYMDFSR